MRLRDSGVFFRFFQLFDQENSIYRMIGNAVHVDVAEVVPEM